MRTPLTTLAGWGFPYSPPTEFRDYGTNHSKHLVSTGFQFNSCSSELFLLVASIVCRIYSPRILLLAADDKPVAKKDSKRATLPVQVAKIDASMQASWEDNKIKPSPVEDDVKWCRRLVSGFDRPNSEL